MASKYIDKEQVLEGIYEAIGNINFTSPYQNDIGVMVHGMECVAGIVESAPEVDVAPVVHGRWIAINPHKDVEGWIEYDCQCSACGEISWEVTNYCPHCGAKMDEEVEYV